MPHFVVVPRTPGPGSHRFAALLLLVAVLTPALGWPYEPFIDMSDPRPQKRERSELERASANGDVAAIERLFSGATARIQYSALKVAIYHGQSAAAEVLLRKGVDPDATHGDERTALHIAMMPPSPRRTLSAADIPEMIAPIMLLCRHGADPNKLDRDGNAPLHVGPFSEVPAEVQRARIRALLACGADPNLPSHTGRRLYVDYPLIGAVSAGDTELVTLLLAHGAKVNVVAERRTPLSAAVDRDDTALVQMLLDRGADVAAGPTDLVRQSACSRGGSRAAAVLALLLPRVPPASQMREYALICAAEEPNADVVRLLLDAGADVNFVDPRRHSVLGNVLAAYDRTASEKPRDPYATATQQARRIEMARYLVERGAQVELDRDVLDVVREDHPMGRALAQFARDHYARLLRECIEQRPRHVSRRAPLNTGGAPPGANAYAIATYAVLDHIPLPEAMTFSPDGRWIVMGTASKQSLAVYAPADDTVAVVARDGADLEDLRWSVDSRFLRMGARYLDLGSGHPVVRRDAAFAPARRAGHEPCLSRDEHGEPVPYISARSEPVWSPRDRIRYELVQLRGDRYAMTAIKDGKPDPLVEHDLGQARAEIRRRVAELQAEFEEHAKREKREDFSKLQRLMSEMSRGAEKARFSVRGLALSPTGQYLYYVIAATSPDWGGDLPPRRLVVDVLSRPARVWEVDAEVDNPMWHPNGHELYFATPVAKPRGPPMYQSQDHALAVARFPDDVIQSGSR